MTLNPNAPEFVPQSLEHTGQEEHWEAEQEGEPTQDELDELEAVDAWVDLMASLEEEENEHIIAIALQYAPAAAQVIEEEVLSAERKREHHHGHSRKGHKGAH